MRCDNELGKAPSHRLFEAVTVKIFEAVTVKKKDGVETPRSFGDYEVTINRDAIAEGVEVIERI
jgi:CRISPR-associated protein Csd2